jgi:hypothetical protein
MEQWQESAQRNRVCKNEGRSLPETVEHEEAFDAGVGLCAQIQHHRFAVLRPPGVERTRNFQIVRSAVHSAELSGANQVGSSVGRSCSSMFSLETQL